MIGREGYLRRIQPFITVAIGETSRSVSARRLSATATEEARGQKRQDEPHPPTPPQARIYNVCEYGCTYLKLPLDLAHAHVHEQS